MLRVGLVQTCTGIDPAANARSLALDVGRLAERGAGIVFTPEMSGLLDRDARRMAANGFQEDDEPTLAALRTVAAQKNISIVVGSLAVRQPDGRFANRSFVIGNDGAVAQRYDKLHLFDVDLPTGERYRESATYVAGDAVRMVEFPWGRLGLSICYDLRFPALFAGLAQAGAAIISVPAAFTRPTGAAHWHVLLRARAIETGAFIIAAAQSGVHADGRETYGHALVVDPWGEILLDMETGPGIATVDLDLGRVDDMRARIPNLRHVRPLGPPEIVVMESGS